MQRNSVFRIGTAAIVLTSLSAEATLQPDLHHEDCGTTFVDVAFCHQAGLEPWNFHTTHNEFEQPQIPSWGLIASGQVNSAAPFRGYEAGSATPRFGRPRLFINGEEVS